MRGLTEGQPITVKCPVLKNGRKLTGVYAGEKNERTAYVIYTGNSKRSTIAYDWILEAKKA